MWEVFLFSSIHIIYNKTVKHDKCEKKTLSLTTVQHF